MAIIAFVIASIAGWGAVRFARATADAERDAYKQRFNDTYPGPM